MNNDVEKLWELQQVVSQLADREKQLSVKPESFAEVDRQYESANQEMQKLEESLESLARERRRVEGELADHQELLKKYQGALMQVKNQLQYAAAWKEIDGTRKQVRELEDAALKTLGDSETLQQQLDAQRGGFDELKSRYDSAHTSWQLSLGDLRDEIEKFRSRQEQIEATLPEKLKREFFSIARKRQNLAVARADGDTCNACRTRIRPALSQQLKRGELVHCEGCHRILYREKFES